MDANVVVIFKRHAAFEAVFHFLHLILEALERFQRAFVDHHVVAQQADARTATHDALRDAATRNLADLRDVEDLQDDDDDDEDDDDQFDFDEVEFDNESFDEEMNQDMHDRYHDEEEDSMEGK